MRVALKTDGSRRDVVLLPRLAKILEQHKKGSDDETIVMLRRPTDLVFRTNTGGSMGYHNLNQRGVQKAAADAGLTPDGAPNSPVTTCDTRRISPDPLRTRRVFG